MTSRVALGHSGWTAWPDVLLRSAGFPAGGVDWFSAPDCAEVADRMLQGEDVAAEFDTAFVRALTQSAEAVHRVACDERFREAVTWQNPDAAKTIDGIIRDGVHARRNERRRRREDLVARYWQRYCLKNDTIGYYGPMLWGLLDPDADGLRVQVGEGVEEERFAVLERWAVAAVADTMTEDPVLRPWLPVSVLPHLSVEGHEVHHPSRPVLRLSTSEQAVVQACPRNTAMGLARDLAEDPASPFRAPADVLATLERLTAKEVTVWGLDLPMSVHALDALGDAVSQIPDATARLRAEAHQQTLVRARAGLQAARGPQQVREAIEGLDAHVEEVSDLSAHRLGGQTYAGRTTCHLEATRALELTLGGEVLEAISTPLQPLLQGARWLTAQTAEIYERLLTQAHDELAAGQGGSVPFSEVWFTALGSIFGQTRPVDDVVEDFVHRWSTVFGITGADQGDVIRMTSDELAVNVDEAFPAARPGWSEAAVHSPDVHICATSLEAVQRGDFHLVLGEIHIGFPAFDTSFFMLGHDDPDRLVHLTRQDFPNGRILPIFPVDWPRNTARNGRAFDGGNDVHLAFAPAPGVDRSRAIPVTGFEVARHDGRLVARAPNGRTWPLIEMFAGLVGLQTFDAWKLTGSIGRTPRIVVDRMTLARQTWRMTGEQCCLAEVTGERDRFLAARRLRLRMGLPERVFVRISTEIKPFYVDFSSPIYAKALCSAVRSAVAQAGLDVQVSISELLPTAQDAWLTDAAGAHYCSELRFQVLDPARAEHQESRHSQ